MKLIISLLLLMPLALNLKGQDTLFLEQKIEYFSNKDTGDMVKFKDKQKGFFHKMDCRKEVIVFSDSLGIQQCCFYYDGMRTCDNNKYYFRLENDSIEIEFNHYKEKWNYQSNDKGYKLMRKRGEIREVGYCESLIPLVKTGEFHGINLLGDTVYSIMYEDYITPQIIDNGIVKTGSKRCYSEGEADPYADVELNRFMTEKINEIYRLPFLESRVEGFLLAEVVFNEQWNLEQMFFRRSSGCPYFDKAFLQAINSKEMLEKIKATNQKSIRFLIRRKVE